MEFTKLEVAALAMFVEEYGEEFPDLAAQLACAHPSARENSGGGFFTDLVIDKNGGPLGRIDSPLDGIALRPHGMNSKLELLLHFKDRIANLLEGYAIEGEDTSNVDFNAGEFSDLALRWPKRKKTL